jgi:hypothetical protein
MLSPPPVAADQRLERYAKPEAAGNVFAAKLFYTYVPEEALQNEWNVTFSLRNDADSGENCSAYFQSEAYGKGSTWGICVEAADMSFGVKNPPLSPIEADVWAGADNAGNGIHAVVGDIKRLRTGLPTSGRVSGANGVLVSNNGHQNARWICGATLRHWDRAGMSIEGDGGQFGIHFSGRMSIAVDFTGVDGSQSVIRLKDGQRISLDATDSVQIGYSLGRVKIWMLGMSIFELDINTHRLYLRDTSIGQL